MNDDAKMAWLAARRNGISGTDVAAICGLSKWTTALKLWAWKTGKLAEDGEETEQSKISRDFADSLSKKSSVEIVFADESLSSVRAESSQNYRSTSGKYFDDVAACYILEEFFGNING